MPKNHQLPI